MIYPTARAILLAALGAPLALLLALAGGPLWLIGPAWTAAILAAVLADAVIGADRRRLSLNVTGAGGLALGHAGSVAVSAAFDGPAPRTVEAAVETNDRVIAAPVRQTVVFSEGLGQARFTLTPRRRGEARLSRIWLRWRGPLGLVFKQRDAPCDFEAPIGLDLPRVKADAARLISSNPLFGARLQSALGGASEFHALADYQPGMDRRRIDWKQSARHRTLLAKEYEVERNHHIVLAVDSGRQMCEPVAGMARIDHVLQASLLMAYGALKAGDRVGLYAFDARPRLWTGVLAGQNAFIQLQRQAAKVDYCAEETNYTLGLTQLGAHLRRRSLVVVFTEFTDSTTAELMLDNIARLLKTHRVLFVVLEDEELSGLERAPIGKAVDVSMAVLAGALTRERELVIARLRRMGVDVLHAPVAQIGPALLARYMALKQRLRL
jgi:uncharacterized protein (DUF58 family)